MIKGALAGLILILVSGTAIAGEADALKVKAVRDSSDDSWRFTVTVQHADEGWDHYADRWEVLDPDGRLLGTRTLLHPHVEEQPFTRSLGGVFIPETVTSVTVRAGDSVHDFGGAEITVELPR